MTEYASLTEELIATIRATGPISVSDFMAAALLHPKFGYYTTQVPFGRKGDFITSPEISQTFGELIGLWTAQTWIDQGSPATPTIIELGPGRGTLMADFLRAIRQAAPAFWEAADVYMLEASPQLRETQSDALQGLAAREVTWISGLSDLPERATYIIANEFFDALPIRQFQKTNKGWCERLVALTQEGAELPLGFAPTQSPIPPTVLPACAKQASTGDILEVCPGAAAIGEALGQHLESFGGCALFIDYGHRRSACGDTLQAVRDHAFTHLFDKPGSADITAHVDFEALRDALHKGGALTTDVQAQGDFLKELGIEQRAAVLAKSLEAEARDNITSAINRLIDPEQMGSLFKVMAAYPSAASIPPVFAAGGQA